MQDIRLVSVVSPSCRASNQKRPDITCTPCMFCMGFIGKYWVHTTLSSQAVSLTCLCLIVASSRDRCVFHDAGKDQILFYRKEGGGPLTLKILA